MDKYEQAPAPLGYRLAYFVIDHIIAKIRYITLPFWLAAKTTTGVIHLFWFLSNEFGKTLFGHCGSGVRIYGRSRITSPKNLHIGNNVHINSNATLRCEGGLYINDNAHISRNVVIYTINHNYIGKCLPYDEGKLLKPVHIGKNVWIGINVTVVPGVTIGDGAIVGMGTVVARDVPPLSIVGSPAQRIIKYRDKHHYGRLEADRRYGGMSGFYWER